jgi:hypothetical protein
MLKVNRELDMSTGRPTLRGSNLYVIRFAVLTSCTYLFTVVAEVVYFHLITVRHTPQSVGLLWTGDRPVAEAT